MLAQVKSGAVDGIEGYLVDVEVDVASGLPAFDIVGLPDTAVKESRDRVKSALKNSGFEFPLGRITANLAPADIRKEGPAFDLPLAVGILAATGQIRSEKISDYIISGELSLSGGVREIRGVLPIGLAAVHGGYRGFLLPRANAPEAAVVKGLEAVPVNDLGEVVACLNGQLEPVPLEEPKMGGSGKSDRGDLKDVKGQETAKRALEIAAAGDHNLLLVGPPGSGKTMLASRMPSILPPMTREEALEVTKIYSICGRLPRDRPLITERPFRSPHHTITDAGLTGGGRNPLPGEISLAHHGILFLDELPEFRRSTLEVLRQPLEVGLITLSRSQVSVTYPARFVLIGAMNPCRCGYWGSGVRECTCPPGEVRRYRSRVSGPLWDRIDMHVEMPALDYDDLQGSSGAESSSAVRERVVAARRRQKQRYRSTGARTNSSLKAAELEEYCRMTSRAEGMLREAFTSLGLSARAYDRIRRLALTIADLEGKARVSEECVAEAIQYRTLDREL